MTTTVYHGTHGSSVYQLLDGSSRHWPGLYVTDSVEHAQRYADAQASREVVKEIRRVAGSAVVALVTGEAVAWSRRPDSHHTLDVCEAVISRWDVAAVTVYVNRHDLKASSTNVGTKRNPRWVSTYDDLREQLGSRLTIVVVD